MERRHDQTEDIDQLRQILPSKSTISKKGDGYEIVISSNMDDALTFFVTFPKSKLSQPKGRPAATEPE